MNYLGLDYGLKHIGIALAIGPLAEPLSTVATSSASQIIKNLIQQHQIDKLIIGRPNESLESEFEKFTNLLVTSRLKFEIVDETLSSHDARISLLHTSNSRRKDKEHSASAAIILQNYLDNLSSPLD